MSNAALDAQRERARCEPHSAQAWVELARCLEEAGEPREAIEAYGRALANGAPGIDINLRLGALHMLTFDQEKAVAHLEKVLAAEPGHADALCMLGMSMLDLKRFDAAADYLARAVDERPAFPEAHFNLGLARFEAGNLHGAAQSFARSYALNRGDPGGFDPLPPAGRDAAPPLSESEMGVNAMKLRHDWEQLEYLVGLGRLPGGYAAVADDYRTLLESIAGQSNAGVISSFDAKRHPLVARTYKRPLFVAPCPVPAGPIINPAIDGEAVGRRYLEARPNIAVVDDLLTREALDSLRRFCRENTIWNNVQSGYLGAYFYDGFACDLLLQFARDLRERFPHVIRGLPLQMMWGYKYDCALQGIGVHADAAAVNVNFWITEDEANLDPERGGLLIYPHEAPMEWGYAKFNKDPATIYRYLESVGSVPLRVPYRANRAVIFDSDLFHATDTLHFREGYVNRRINITLLYGLRSA